MKKVFLFSISILIFSTSCRSLIVQSNHYSYSHPTYDKPQVIEKGSYILNDAILLGTVSAGGDMFTPTKKCTYISCLNAILEEARIMGGKYIEIISITEPGEGTGTCYSMVAKVYKEKE